MACKDPFVRVKDLACCLRFGVGTCRYDLDLASYDTMLPVTQEWSKEFHAKNVFGFNGIPLFSLSLSLLLENLKQLTYTNLMYLFFCFLFIFRSPPFGFKLNSLALEACVVGLRVTVEELALGVFLDGVAETVEDARELIFLSIPLGLGSEGISLCDGRGGGGQPRGAERGRVEGATGGHFFFSPLR